MAKKATLASSAVGATRPAALNLMPCSPEEGSTPEHLRLLLYAQIRGLEWNVDLTQVHLE